ncbi:hypothetical protein [Sandarakinorhabdus sp.]|uniref:hypothetical protein n=1 Tax=Sandarakinorhabdus sp. TaxID=1916663 RepID=UPI003F6FB9A0
MSNVIRLLGAEKGETPKPLRSVLHAHDRPALGGAARRSWRYARLYAECLGWLVILGAIVAAAR